MTREIGGGTMTFHDKFIDVISLIESQSLLFIL